MRVERQQIDLDYKETVELVREALTARGYRNLGPLSFPYSPEFGLQGLMVNGDIEVPDEQQIQVGDGATCCIWPGGSQSPFTVIQIINAEELVVQADDYELHGTCWFIKKNTKNYTFHVVLQDGEWKSVPSGHLFTIGSRSVR